MHFQGMDPSRSLCGLGYNSHDVLSLTHDITTINCPECLGKILGIAHVNLIRASAPMIVDDPSSIHQDMIYRTAQDYLDNPTGLRYDMQMGQQFGAGPEFLDHVTIEMPGINNLGLAAHQLKQYADSFACRVNRIEGLSTPTYRFIGSSENLLKLRTNFEESGKGYGTVLAD